jgi:hypothetical protein
MLPNEITNARKNPKNAADIAKPAYIQRSDWPSLGLSHHLLIEILAKVDRVDQQHMTVNSPQTNSHPPFNLKYIR